MKRTYFLISTLLFVATLSLTRGFAQDYVRYATVVGHTDNVFSVYFSPDGRTLVSGGLDDTVRLWDVATATLEHTFAGHTDNVFSVYFSPDGRTLASGSADKTVRLWDANTDTLKQILKGHTGQVLSVAFSPNGYTIASGSADKTVRLWDTNTDTLKQILKGHTRQVLSVVFSPDGHTIASGSADKTVRLWDVATGRHKQTFIGHTEAVFSVCFSPDGRTIASGDIDRTIHLWDVATGTLKQTVTGHTDWVNSICFSPDGRTLASAGDNRTIHLWDVATSTLKQTVTGHTDWVNSICFSPDGRTLASGSLDNTICLWRLSSPQPIDTNSLTSLKLFANQIYDNTIRSVMWLVNPDIGEGSGVLIDKQFKLAITNAHVTGEQNTIDVYFPAPDEKGELIKDRNFYLTNSGVLKRLGYYTKGRVVARNEETDLAIIRLDGLPETARGIDWSFTMPTTNSGDIVYILGNPGGQELWRWTLGEFLNNRGDFLHLQSDVFGGNSGGPVLNKQGVLLGIVARSDRHMNALAIPVRDISRLLSESQLKHSRFHR
ncbi:hypothetical protein C6499_14295 [Candidatus Poribacteria bacterium]|nr:MAG: hypothetical protein C6499_14295 [Candidatus Poribacteria bacterium]